MSRIPEPAQQFIYGHDIYKRMVEADVPSNILLGVRFMVYDAWREAQRVDKLIGKLGGSNPPLVGSTPTRPAIRSASELSETDPDRGWYGPTRRG